MKKRSFRDISSVNRGENHIKLDKIVRKWKRIPYVFRNRLNLHSNQIYGIHTIYRKKEWKFN